MKHFNHGFYSAALIFNLDFGNSLNHLFTYDKIYNILNLRLAMRPST